MKKRINKLVLILMLTIFLIFTTLEVDADVGSFESYDSGGSWGGSSSWDSGSSWGGYSGSSWDDGFDSGFNSGSLLGLMSMFLPYGSPSIIIIIIVIILIRKFGRNSNTYGQRQPRPDDILYNRPAKPDTIREEGIYKRIQQVDPLFRKEEFISWSKNLFVKLQQAWTARDWSTIRTFETNELFEQHKNQLQGYVDNNQINVMDRICVNFANLYDFRQDGDKDILTVRLNSRMSDYIIDATTKEVIRGDKNKELTNTYLLTFVRNSSIKTEASEGEVKTTNCPNCGAPTQITSSGKCEYCGSVITTDEHDWALANLEREIR